MPTIDTVTYALLRAGERRATRQAGGFQVEALDARTAAVRWCAPERQPDSDAGLAFVEEYARLLRSFGIAALVTTDRHDPRVLCQIDPRQ